MLKTVVMTPRNIWVPGASASLLFSLKTEHLSELQGVSTVSGVPRG